MVEYCSFEGRGVGRIPDRTVVPVMFIGAPAANGVEQIGITVVDEIGEGSGLAILLSHEEEWDAWSKQQQGSGQPQPIEWDEHAQTGSVGPIAHLVVVLVKDDEATWIDR
jgi:hypothetical protein